MRPGPFSGRQEAYIGVIGKTTKIFGELKKKLEEATNKFREKTQNDPDDELLPLRMADLTKLLSDGVQTATKHGADVEKVKKADFAALQASHAALDIDNVEKIVAQQVTTMQKLLTQNSEKERGEYMSTYNAKTKIVSALKNNHFEKPLASALAISLKFLLDNEDAVIWPPDAVAKCNIDGDMDFK